MTTKQWARIKRNLLTEREHLIELLQRNTEYAQTEIDDTTRDTGDLSAASHDRALLNRLQEIEANHLNAINEALMRIEQGEYGVCHECGGEIGAARLEAIPWAKLCLECQQHSDSTAPSFPPSRVHGLDELGNNHAA